MQNVNSNNIQDRLQVLHDYIQRTIDALNDLSNSTRQVVQGLGLGRTDINTVQGLNHTTLQNSGYGFVPFGVNAVPFGVNPYMQLQQLQQLHHTGLAHSTLPAYNLVQTPYGIMQVPVAQNWQPNWMGAQNVGGLNHSTFLPTQQLIPTQQGWVNVQGQGFVPFNQGVNQGWINPAFAPMMGGLSHTSHVMNQGLPVVNQGIPVVSQGLPVNNTL